ncbi:hypothetical protein [Neobacillus ginsengisoli]|uniref:HNH endonuclease n=1 Tax=Neobacillus ginsengisoli TaxID=904295 RepID=A0ABT9XXM3_9BACI|nr:hypothetical protein [Neobacillus ginsengisoli]MDQ0200320.1 hypothetical protein [Neobacillus ginsengisoli]
MPSKPLKPCNKIGCSNLTKGRYCDEHKQQELQKGTVNRDKTRQYDKQRGSAASRGWGWLSVLKH